MGKRLTCEQEQACSVVAIEGSRKRKRVGNEYQHQEAKKWHAEESSSSPPPTPPKATPSASESKTKELVPFSNASFDDNSPKPVYHLRPSIVNGILLEDLTGKKWRMGKPIGKGNFGEIFLASDDIKTPVTSENAEYIAKIEPHSNGPLFVEIHCLLNAGKKNDENPLPPGMPEYIASGSHYFGNSRYRFLIIKRFDRDLHSLIKNRRITQKAVLTLALQILDVLQHLHDKGYCHNDIKAQNLMISKCSYRKSQLHYSNTDVLDLEKVENNVKIPKAIKDSSNNECSDADSGNSSNEDDYDEQKTEPDSSDTDEDEEQEDDDDDDEEDEEEEEQDMYKTPINRRNRIKPTIEYSGSNPVRACRRAKRHSIYDEMVKSHYLRPAKRICYSEFFNEDNSKDATDSDCKLSRRTSARNKQKPNIFTGDSNDSEKNKAAGKATDDAEMEEMITEERIHLIDFGLASKFIDKGIHRPFVMDQRRAHDGTLEFTSRDAHMGAHSRRSDLECLGYNLIYWSQGYLPWRDAAAQHQNEKVHWVKEYLMKDVKEMMKHIYGKQVPKYLGEYLQYVGQLAYHERPDYDKCRRIFLREYTTLGYKTSDISLSSDEIIKTSVKVKEEIENNNVIEMKNIKSIMKNLNVIMPFHESTLSNRVSPKNLRSKSAKKKTSRQKFSWTEILSQDPDQIARDRAEKEYDREPIVETPSIRYQGKPTYAILEIQKRLKLKDRIAAYEGEDGESSDEDKHHRTPAPTPNNTKPWSVKKRSSALPAINENPTVVRVNCNDSAKAAAAARLTRTKTAHKLATVSAIVRVTSIPTTSSTKQITNNIPITSKSTTSPTDNKRQRRAKRCLIKTGIPAGDFTTDESSCSSINSNTMHISNKYHPRNTTVVKIKGIHKQQQLQQQQQLQPQKQEESLAKRRGRRRKVINRSDRCSSTDRSLNSNNSFNSNLNSEEDDTSNFSDHANLFSPTKKKRSATSKRLARTNKILHSGSASKNHVVSLAPLPTAILVVNEEFVGAKRRKRSIPKKRKSSNKDDYSDEVDMLDDERELRTFKKRACRG